MRLSPASRAHLLRQLSAMQLVAMSETPKVRGLDQQWERLLAHALDDQSGAPKDRSLDASKDTRSETMLAGASDPLSESMWAAGSAPR